MPIIYVYKSCKCVIFNKLCFSICTNVLPLGLQKWIKMAFNGVFPFIAAYFQNEEVPSSLVKFCFEFALFPIEVFPSNFLTMFILKRTKAKIRILSME